MDEKEEKGGEKLMWELIIPPIPPILGGLIVRY
jgi:hypothetical protein